MKRLMIGSTLVFCGVAGFGALAVPGMWTPEVAASIALGTMASFVAGFGLAAWGWEAAK